MSAILLDKDYFELLIEHTTEIDGLHVATPEVLIPLKMHAHLNLLKVEHPDNKKHLRDVIKLSSLLDDETSVNLKGEPKNDFLEFIPILEEVDEQRVQDILRGINPAGRLTKEVIIKLLKSIYILE